MELSALSLHTADRESARDCAFDQDADIRFRVKLEVAVFIRPYSPTSVGPEISFGQALGPVRQDDPP